MLRTIAALALSASLLAACAPGERLSGPREVRTGPGYTEFAFATAAGDEPATIMFEFRPATFGHVRGRVTSEGAPPLLFDQYILP